MAEEISLNSHIARINDIANQAADLGYFGLQDSCLLIMESLQGRYQDTATPLPSKLGQTLSALPQLVAAYLKKAPDATARLIEILVHPDLDISLVDDERMMLEDMLYADIAADAPVDEAAKLADTTDESSSAEDNTQISASPTFSLAHYSALIGECASHAANHGQYGLQDACLLVQDALDALPATAFTPELWEALNTLPQLIEQHPHNPVVSTDRILDLIRHPGLNIAITDDELAMLKSLLLEGYVNDQQPVNVDTTATTSNEETLTPAPISSTTLELVELLQMEAELVGKLLSEMALDASLPEHLARLADELERYTNAATIAGFTGLAEICSHVQGNLNGYYQNIGLFGDAQCQLLQSWLDQVKFYLATFTEEDAGLPLLAHLCNPDWPQPLTSDQALAILQLLKGTSLSTESTPSTKREQVATEADVALTLPADVNQELLEILLQELPSYTQEFSEALHNLQQGGNTEDLDIAQRVAHTLKGSANTVGIGGIANLTHHLEDILEACAKAQQLPNQRLLSSLIDAADCLEAMSDYLIGQSDEPPYGAQQVLQEILDLANHIDQNGLQDFEAPDTIDGIEHPNHLPPPPIPKAEHTPSEPANASQQTANIRVPSEQIDTLLRMSGESLILNTQANERLRRIKAQLLAMENQFNTLQRLSDELEELIDIKDLTGKAISDANQEFDSLEMDQYNELYTTSRRLIEAAFDAKEMNVDAKAELEQMGEVLEYQQRLVIDTQSAIMETRLVPVASITSRLQRTLRQTCRLTGKTCTLSLSGEHLMVDNDVLGTLVDPLMHILRNAIDHGIENEAGRRAANKPLVGHLHIDFDREGNNILVRCQDDGHGLDFDAIRATAIARGVVQPDQPVTEDELKRFILRPNFSTRSESTQISGRGVGMNVVHHQVVTQGGSLTLNSEYGKGLTVELRMPLPISRSHAILALVGPYRVAITSKGLKQIIYANAYDFYATGEELTLRLDDGSSYPTTTLNRLLHVAESRKKNPRHNAVLLVQQEETTTAVILDGILDSLDIVIKDFGQYIKKIPGYIGAAILGDGTVSPVLDIPELLRLAANTGQDDIAPEEIANPSALLPKVLVVDDSLSQRRALQQLLTDAGFAVHMARDGIEAVELLAEFTPDIMLTDLEMPRMNGIELTAHVRNRPHNTQLPIIMITSRTTQKHRKMAEEAGVNFYIAKPVREEDLLGKIRQLLENTAAQTDLALY